MQNLLQRKTYILFILFLILFLVAAVVPGYAADNEVVLTDMSKEENPDRTRIVFSFSRMPEYSVEQSGQRVDLQLEQVRLSEGLRKLPEDEKVVKIMLGEGRQHLLVSLLLRRNPQRVVTEKRNANKLLMDIYWQGESNARPGVAFRISDMPPKKAGRRAAQHQRKSPWEGRWDEFYHNYFNPWEINLPVNYSLPVLPALITDEASPLWPLQQHVEKGMFLSLIRDAAAMTELDEDQRYLRDVLLAEAQLRSGAIAAGAVRLHQLKHKKGRQQERVEYLTAYGEAADGRPLVAKLQLQDLLTRIQADHTFEAFSRLLAAEASLGADLDTDALAFIEQKQQEWPDAILLTAQLRQADALAGLDRRAEALEIYTDLLDEEGLFSRYVFACNRAADSAFLEQDYGLARKLYGILSEELVDKSGYDMALYATGAAALNAGDPAWGRIGLQKATLEEPGSQGADRSAIRLADMEVIRDGELGLERVLEEYRQLGNSSDYRVVREEALFKHALGLYLLLDYRGSVEELMTFRRNFSRTALRREVDLLLLEQLPKVIHTLLEEDNDLQAVVLVEKNRKLLLGSGFDQAFLQDLANAFEKLGLYDRASRVLLYLFDRTAGSNDQAAVYLPLARTYLKRDQYAQAGQYAERYLEQFPQGEDASELYSLLLDAFERQQRDDDLLAWMERDSRPHGKKLELRAAMLFWKQGRFDKVAESLEWLLNDGHQLEVKEMALLGEAYYQLERNGQAQKIYQTLHDDPDYDAQARYRSAQLLLRGGNRKAAIALLESAVEADAQGSWGQLARDLLVQEQR